MAVCRRRNRERDTDEIPNVRTDRESSLGSVNEIINERRNYCGGCSAPLPVHIMTRSRTYRSRPRAMFINDASGSLNSEQPQLRVPGGSINIQRCVGACEPLTYNISIMFLHLLFVIYVLICFVVLEREKIKSMYRCQNTNLNAFFKDLPLKHLRSRWKLLKLISL